MRALLLVATLFCVLVSIRADTLILKSGKTLEGKIIDQSRFQVRIRTVEGDVAVAKSAVRRITFGTSAPPEPKQPEAAPAKNSASANDAQPVPTASKAGPGAVVGETDLLAALQKKAEEERKRAELERKRREWRRQKEARDREIARRQVEREKYGRDRDRWDGAFWRSAVFPGWGQYHKGDQRGAAVFGGAAAGAGALWFLAFQDYDRAVASYNANSDLAVLGANDTALALVGYLGAQQAQVAAGESGQRAGLFLLLYLGNYIYNLFDVRSDRPVEPRFSPLKPLAPEPTAGLSIFFFDEGLAASSGATAGRSLVFSYSMTF